MNEIPNAEEITNEPSFFQNAKFVLEPTRQLRIGRRPFAVTSAQTLVAKFAQIFFARFPSRRWILRIFRTPKLKAEMAAFPNMQCVRDRVRKIAEELLHLGW